MQKITILLADDHKLIRDSWSFILNNDERFLVVGETSSGEEAIKLTRKKKPRVILMDVNMAPVDGFEATRQIHKTSPDSKIIAVSMHSMPAYAKKMFKLGAMGYVTKNSSKEEMMNAIVEVNNGNRYVCNEVKNILADQELEENMGVRDLNSLSDRELEIAQLIKQGRSSREIALDLDLSLKTVEVHRYNILKKLKLKNAAALVNFINNRGL